MSLGGGCGGPDPGRGTCRCGRADHGGPSVEAMRSYDGIDLSPPTKKPPRPVPAERGLVLE